MRPAGLLDDGCRVHRKSWRLDYGAPLEFYFVLLISFAIPPNHLHIV